MVRCRGIRPVSRLVAWRPARRRRSPAARRSCRSSCVFTLVAPARLVSLPVDPVVLLALHAESPPLRRPSPVACWPGTRAMVASARSGGQSGAEGREDGKTGRRKDGETGGRGGRSGGRGGNGRSTNRDGGRD